MKQDYAGKPCPQWCNHAEPHVHNAGYTYKIYPGWHWKFGADAPCMRIGHDLKPIICQQHA